MKYKRKKAEHFHYCDHSCPRKSSFQQWNVNLHLLIRVLWTDYELYRFNLQRMYSGKAQDLPSPTIKRDRLFSKTPLFLLQTSSLKIAALMNFPGNLTSGNLIFPNLK